MKLSREAIQRMVRGSATSVRVSGSGGSSGGGGGGDGHTHSNLEDLEKISISGTEIKVNGGDAKVAEAGHATTADTATNAGHATTADTANTATTAQNLATNSSDWAKILRKDTADTAAEVITFAKGLIARLRSFFYGGVTIAKAATDALKALIVSGGIQTDTLDATGDVNIGGEVQIDGDMNVSGVATFEDIVNMNDVNVDGVATFGDGTTDDCTRIENGNVETKNLTVTGLAHFFELIIDKIKAVGGAVMFSPADGFEIARVDPVDISTGTVLTESQVETYYTHGTLGYKLYWIATNTAGKATTNKWKVNDQALCRSMNEAEGTTYSVNNKYWWSLVTAVSSSPEDVEVEEDVERPCHWIIVSCPDERNNTGQLDGELYGVAEVGDSVTMLGYRGTDDAARQSAMYIAAYWSLDGGLTAPLFAQYMGINDFDLASHRKSYWDAMSARFVGDFEVVSGSDAETWVNGLISAVTNPMNTNITQIRADLNGIATRVSTAEGNISTLQQTATGIETRVSTAEGNISTLQQTATGIETRVSTAEGNISTLQQTATSISLKVDKLTNGSDLLLAYNSDLASNPGNLIHSVSGLNKIGWYTATTQGVTPAREGMVVLRLTATTGETAYWGKEVSGNNYAQYVRYEMEAGKRILFGMFLASVDVSASAEAKVTLGFFASQNTTYPATELEIPVTFTDNCEWVFAHYTGVIPTGYNYVAVKVTFTGSVGAYVVVGGWSACEDIGEYEYANYARMLATGIDIEKRKITLTADQLVCRNNSGVKTFWLDKDGNATFRGAVNNMVTEITEDSDLLIFNYDSRYDLDVLRCGDVVVIDSVPSDLSYIQLPYYIQNSSGTEYACRTKTKYGGEEHDITPDELKQLVGKKITFFLESSGSADGGKRLYQILNPYPYYSGDISSSTLLTILRETYGGAMLVKYPGTGDTDSNFVGPVLTGGVYYAEFRSLLFYDGIYYRQGYAWIGCSVTSWAESGVENSWK